MTAPADRDPREVARRVLELDESASLAPWEFIHRPPPSRDDPGWRGIMERGDRVIVTSASNKWRRRCSMLQAEIGNIEDSNFSLVADYRTAAPALAREVLTLRDLCRTLATALDHVAPHLLLLDAPLSVVNALREESRAALSAFRAHFPADKEPRP